MMKILPKLFDPSFGRSISVDWIISGFSRRMRRNSSASTSLLMKGIGSFGIRLYSINSRVSMGGRAFLLGFRIELTI